MKILECHVFAALASEYDDSRTSQQGSVTVARSGRRALHLWLDPPAGVQVQHVGVVQVHVPLLLTGVVVTAKVEDRCTNQGR